MLLVIFRESHCRTCDRKFTGAYKDHKETPEHKVGVA